ncbi:MAG TPA: hypothetical protein VHE35_27615 [Kofleriaceae bacterium]|nr:hypothetical protein [Kofleriaceae bacterium]
MRSLLVGSLVALVGGCATASAPSIVGDDDNPPVDARTADGRLVDARITIDAPPPPVDAPAMQTITLSQTGSQTVEAGASIACTLNDGSEYTTENSYYRAFRLSDFGVNRPFTPTTITFGVEQATTFIGSQTVQAKLYTLNGGVMSTANLVPLSGNNVTVPDSGVSMISVPVVPAPVVQPNQTLVAEIFVPDGSTVGNIFFIGANNQTETATGYLRAPGCSITDAVTYASLGYPTTRLVLTVTGTY